MQESGMYLDITIPVLVSLIVSALFYAGLSRKLWNLQCDLSATQAQLLRERNQRASLGRSKDKEQLELLRELGAGAAPLKPVNPLLKFGIKG
jgi:hypothetical protein